MVDLIDALYKSFIFGRIFHTVIYCLCQELKDCQSVLDLGCGASSPIKYCKNIDYSVGVEIFKPYLEKSKKARIHTRYLHQKIEEADFPPKCFDAVVMIEVIEHLPKKVGLALIKKAEQWAKKKVIISTPNGFLPQSRINNNPWEKHLSGWDLKTINKLGYKSRGLAGLKFLRQKSQGPAAIRNLTSSIKYRPKIFWFVIATLSQLITYHFPQLAFELFNVKKL